VTSVYTVLALIAFAANSILCRLALGGETIDAASFTTVRLISGAIILVAISRLRPIKAPRSQVPPPGWRSATALFAYAIAFSAAYVSLTTGTGALILFGAVQTTMLVSAIVSGERPTGTEWFALTAAIAGLIVLVFPSLSAPPVIGSATMAVAGVSWGFYSLWGRNATDPVSATTVNFVRAAPLALATSVIVLVWAGRADASSRGMALAMSSGALASGLGYIMWYSALPELSATQAALVQLPVPLMTAVGGVVFLAETISMRLVVAAVLILGGVALAMLGKHGRRRDLRLH
jgi:drug/metabolite transporter (DMT)-like permease